MRAALFIFCLCRVLIAEEIDQLEKQSILYRSTQWIERYGQQVAKALPPAQEPQTEKCLSAAAIWYSVDAQSLGSSPLAILSKPDWWNQIQEIGAQAVELRNLSTSIRQTNAERDWAKIVDLAGMRSMLLIGQPLTNLLSSGPDFQLAIRAYKDYPHLFHLIEIDRADWNLLPSVTIEQISSPLPMVTVESLKKLGYLAGKSEQVYPYSPTSCWEATSIVPGWDHKQRRWMFLRLSQTGLPALDWLDPLFVGQRLAGGELIDSLLRLQQTIMIFESTPLICRQRAGYSPSQNALESIALLTRKLGGYSALRVDASLEACKTLQTDLIYDRFTRPALLHALLTEDAEALRLIYRTFLQENIQPRIFVHELQSYTEAPCEWSAFLQNPKQTYRYYEEEITGELLRERLLQEDQDRLSRKPSPYAPPIAPLFGLCSDPVSLNNLSQNQKAQLHQAHLLLALFYAMQPGVFSFSALDLAGGGLHSPLSRQLKETRSFASRLKLILSARRDQQFEQAELIDVLPTKQKGLILLLHRLPSTQFLALTAVNFSSLPLAEQLQGSFLANRWAIDLITGQALSKLFGADTLDLSLDALSGKVVLFQPKYYPDYHP